MVGGAPEKQFSEKNFYLLGFAGRTLGITVGDQQCADHPQLRKVVDELVANSTRVVFVLARDVSLDKIPCRTVCANDARLEGQIWRAVRERATVAVRANGSLVDTCCLVGARLGLFKLVCLSATPGIHDSKGRRRAFVDLKHLEQLCARQTAAPNEAATLGDVKKLLDAGLPNINVCTVETLADELFSYSGSGTLFTRERYVVVRRFGIDDYDAADDLIARGIAEGYLAPRAEPGIDALLADGFGAFVEGTHLAGIGALRAPAGAAAGEIASLYTVTRFAGGGIGKHLVRFAVERAKQLGLAYVYACTTFDRVGAFFERRGFHAASQTDVPGEKWSGYDAARRERLRCYRYDLETSPVDRTT